MSDTINADGSPLATFLAKWLESADGGYLLMESSDKTLAPKYSPRAVTKRMKLAEIRAAMWLDRALDDTDGTGDDIETRVKFEMIKHRVESLAPWRYGQSDPEQSFSALGLLEAGE